MRISTRPGFADLEWCARFITAVGRLPYGFPLAVQARHVRFHFFPPPGKGLGLSELQIYDQVETKPRPNAIALPSLSR